MSVERFQTDGFSTGPDPFSDNFHVPSSGGQVEVIHGVYSHALPLGGMTVAEARTQLSDRMNIDPTATAVVDGVAVDEDTRLTTGQVLNFVKRAGEKG